jgi:hypothetical protein
MIIVLKDLTPFSLEDVSEKPSIYVFKLHHEDGGSKERKEIKIIKDECPRSDSIDCLL